MVKRGSEDDESRSKRSRCGAHDADADTAAGEAVMVPAKAAAAPAAASAAAAHPVPMVLPAALAAPSAAEQALALGVGSDPAMAAFTLAMPKVELHAHLNGSISLVTISRLLELKQHVLEPDFVHSAYTMAADSSRSLKECFQLFSVIHQLVDSPEAVHLVTRDVVREFADDGVCYLELRSTPKDNALTGMTKRSYIEAMVLALRECKAEGLDIEVRLLLSVDRRGSPAEAMETAQLAVEYQAHGVVGMDLSGDPHIGHAADFVEAFAFARQRGLKLALHVAEIEEQADSQMILAMRPERIGHATFLDHDIPSGHESRTPVEVCLTSNVMCKTVRTYSEHHLLSMLKHGHPFVLCTDDKGVFTTCLSREYELAARAFNLGAAELLALAASALDFVFADDFTVLGLRERFRQAAHTLLTP